ISSKITTEQGIIDATQADNILYIPVYQQGAPTGTISERRQVLIGFVFATLKMRELMHGIVDDKAPLINFYLFDGKTVTSSKKLLYASTHNLPNTEVPKYQIHKTIVVNGKDWTLLFHATPQFMANINFDRSRIVLVGGILCGLLLFAVIWLPLYSRRLAINLANEITADLRASEARTQAIFDTVVNAIVTAKTDQLILNFNPAAEKMFGYKAEEVIGKNITILMPEPFCTEHGQYITNYLTTGQSKIIGVGREVIGVRRNGETFPIWLAVDIIKSIDEIVFVACIVDISKRKQADEKIRILSSAVEYSPIIMLITDINGD
ncbi:hypothetical protein TI03_06215, partial [Achromatium sp. WMS1]